MDSPHLLAAREAFARHAWQDVLDGYARVSEADVAADDWARLADAAWWTGEIDRSLTAFEQAFHRYAAAGDLARAGMCALLLGAHACERGELSRGSGWMQRARRTLEQCGPCPEQLYPNYFAIYQATDAGDLDLAERLAGELAAAGRHFGDTNLVALGVMSEGRVRIKRGLVDAGLPLLDEAMVTALSADVDPLWAGAVYCHVMDVCHELQDVARAAEWTSATARWCRSFPSAALYVGICRVHRAQLLTVTGDWERATREAESARSDVADMHVGVLAEAYYQIGELRRLSGDAAAARSSYLEAHRCGRDPQPGLALLQLDTGDALGACTALATSLRTTTDPLARARLLAAQVTAATATGRTEDAVRAAAELAEITDRYQTTGLRAAAARAAGEVALAGDDPHEAVIQLTEACRTFCETEAKYDEGTSRALLSEAFTLLGDADRARIEAERACAVLDSLNARPALQRARRRLPPRADDSGLTNRECEVLRLVATGRTNRQIARALSLSEKTISRHLTNIFTKLGVNSRAAATATAYERGLATADKRPMPGAQD